MSFRAVALRGLTRSSEPRRRFLDGCGSRAEPFAHQPVGRGDQMGSIPISCATQASSSSRSCEREEPPTPREALRELLHEGLRRLTRMGPIGPLKARPRRALSSPRATPSGPRRRALRPAGCQRAFTASLIADKKVSGAMVSFVEHRLSAGARQAETLKAEHLEVRGRPPRSSVEALPIGRFRARHCRQPVQSAIARVA
jgi:hypothetical protein